MIPLVYGVWRAAKNPDASFSALVRTCLELGISTFDHADLYGDFGGEARFGAAVAELGLARDRYQLVTKCGIRPVSRHQPENWLKHYDLSRDHIVASVERSLRALRTDRIELLLLHRPDSLMRVEEVAEAFQTLRAEGKVLAFGVSNFAPPQVELLAATLPVKLASHQVQLSVRNLAPLDDGTLDQAQRLGMAVMAWSPLGGGSWLAEGDDGAPLRAVLSRIGAAHGVDASVVALGWLLRHPARISPVLGTQNPARLREQRRAVELALDRQEWYAVLEAARGAPVP